MKPSSWGLSTSKSTAAVKSIWGAMIFVSATYLLLVYVLPTAEPRSPSKNPLHFLLQAPDPNHTEADSGLPRRTVSNLPVTLPPAVQQLLDDLKRRRHIAENDPVSSVFNIQRGKNPLSEEQPCRSRLELPLLYANRRITGNAPPNPHWDAVFKEYSNLHRVCMRKVGNVTDAFLNERSIPGCKFVTGESINGLGNKITFAASLLLYAVITKRVLLLPSNTTANVMCEPFEGSSWRLPRELAFVNYRRYNSFTNVLDKNSNGTDRFLSWVDAAHGNATNVSGQKYFQAEMDNGWQPVKRFFCDTEQQFLSNVEWISAAGCLYFLPQLYAIPSFRPTLEGLFHDPGLSLTYVLRSAFLPNNVAFERIQRVYAMHLETADRRVSVQSRFRGGEKEHQEMGPRVNSRIVQCLQENSLLPNATDGDPKLTSTGMSPPFPIIKVMITSLYSDLYEYVRKIYLRQSTITGESVALVQISSDSRQLAGQDEDLQALVEIICLSLSDALIVTAFSTFGGTAQAYGALRPWMMDVIHKENVQQPCERTPSVDICFQSKFTDPDDCLRCPYDPAVDGWRPLDLIPYLHKCSGLEYEGGVLLLSNTS